MRWNTGDQAPQKARRRQRLQASHLALATLQLTLTCALIQTPARTQASQFFVAPNGSNRGDGTINNPWDLQTALNSPPTVTPGSTVWLRGGTYTGAFTSRLTGTASAPIVVRNYRNERATIDNPTDCSTYVINGSYSWHWGLEIMSSGVKRRTPYAGSDCGTANSVLDRGLGIRNNGSYTKIINCVIHDTQNGVSNWGTWTSGPGLEVYGNLIYYNGWEQTPVGRGHGHGTYTLSKSNGPTRIIDNILHTQFSQGIRMGDEGVFAPYIEGNISYLNGEHMTPMGGRNLYVGGGNNYDTDRSTYVPMSGAVIRSNYTYYRPNTTGATPGNSGASEGLNAGLWWPGASGQIVNNYLAGYGGGHALQLGYWDNFTTTSCSGNTIYGSTGSYAKQQCPATQNTFYSAKPAANAVFVRPNQYERGRAHVAIYNWRNLASVAVSLVSAGLAEGQPFEIRDAMNFYGSPVATGVFSGTSPTSTIPMTGLVRARLTGESDISPDYVPRPHSAPEFGAFIVLPVSAAPPPPSPSPPPPPPPDDGGDGGGGDPQPVNGIILAAPVVSGSTATLSWAPSPGVTILEYALEVGSATGASDLYNASVGTATRITGSVGAGTYYARLRGRTSASTTVWSNEGSFSIGSGGVPCIAPPGKSQRPTGSVVNGLATVTWKAVTGATSYIVQAGTASGRSDVVNANVGPYTAVSAPVPAGFRAYVRVIAVNACGQGAASPELVLK